MIKRAGVVGAGVMGHGIAQVLAMRGIQTTLIDLDQKVLDKAKLSIERNLGVALERGKINQLEREEAQEKLQFRLGLKHLSGSELMIEAVFESLAVKKEIFGEADKLLCADALLASNTSSLSLSEIASYTRRPKEVVGLHFFNPPYIMKLLEIVEGSKTSAKTLQRAKAFAEQINKTSIVVKDSPGFATSRLGICLGNEAMRMLEEGVASAEDIDKAMVLGYKHPIGPLKLTDLVGLDVRLAITEHLYACFGKDTFKPPKILSEKVSKGQLGQKSGHGFYSW